MIIAAASTTELNGLDQSFTISDKLLNRYKGISRLNPAIAERIDDKKEPKLTYQLTTGATSGTFITPHFQQTFELRKFRKQVEYVLNIKKLESATEAKITLEIELDTKETSGGNSGVRLNMEYLEKTGPKVIKRVVDHDIQDVNLAFTQDLSEADLENWSNKRMLGMKVRWFYTENDQPTEVTPAEKYKDDGANVQFRKLANILQSQTTTVEALWEKVTAVRIAWLQEKKYTFDRRDISSLVGGIFATSWFFMA